MFGWWKSWALEHTVNVRACGLARIGDRGICVHVLSRIRMSRFHKTLQGDSVKPCVKNINLHHGGSDCMFKAADLTYCVCACVCAYACVSVCS